MYGQGEVGAGRSGREMNDDATLVAELLQNQGRRNSRDVALAKPGARWKTKSALGAHTSAVKSESVRLSDSQRLD